MAGKTPIYNPQTGETELVPSDQVFRWNNAVNEATGGTPAFEWYYNPEGEHVFGTRPQERYFDPFLQGFVQGQNPYPDGPGPAPYVPGQDRRWDADAPIAPGPKDTGPIFPWEPGPGRPTGPGGDPGTVAPGGGYTPNPQIPQFGGVNPGVSSDMWTRSFDEGAGFAGQHKDFYDTQFRNLLAQQQNFQDDQIRSNMLRQAAEANPQQPEAVDWSWANEGRGLPDVQVGTGADWTLSENLRPGAPNQWVVERLGPQLSNEAQDFWYDAIGFERGPEGAWRRPNEYAPTDWAQQTFLTEAQDPQQLISGSTLDPSNMPYLNELANALFRNTNRASNVPAGYAAPVAGGA